MEFNYSTEIRDRTKKKYTYQKNRFFDLVSFCLNYSKWSAMLIFLLNSVPVVAQKQVDQSTPIFSRQVHLDFHTSEHIPEIGDKFSKKQFQEALKIGHVNQINVFAKCCHRFATPLRTTQTRWNH